MSSYDFLASCYDELTTDVGYPAWADYLDCLLYTSRCV